MTLKVNDILNIYYSLSKIADKEIDFNTACIIASNLKELSVSKEVFEKKRNEIVMKYGEKDKNDSIKQDENGSIKIKDTDTFMKEMDNLILSETDVNLIYISKKSIKDLKVSAKDVMGLIPILKEE